MGIGGIVGNLNGGYLKDSHFSGTVYAPGCGVVGGLTGNAAWSPIERSYATANVSGANFVGGLAGLTYGIKDSFFVGAVDAQVNGGAVAGVSLGTITNTYWVNDTRNPPHCVGRPKGTPPGCHPVAPH